MISDRFVKKPQTNEHSNRYLLQMYIDEIGPVDSLLFWNTFHMVLIQMHFI